MENCQHFTIRGAVDEFRKRDWRLNYPFLVSQALNPEHINALLPYPLDTPQFKWWCCKSCIHDLTTECDSPGTSSYHELDTWKDSSGVDAVIVTATVDMDNDASVPPLNCLNVEIGRSKAKEIIKYPSEYTDQQAAVIGHGNNSGVLITQKHRVMFDLNETPMSETSGQTFGIDGPLTEELHFDNPVSQIAKLAPANEQHTEKTEAPEEVPVATDDLGNNNFSCSLEKDKDDSFKSSDDNVISKGDMSKKRRKKYRTLSELLNCKRENSETGQSNGPIDIVPVPCQKIKIHLENKKMPLRIHKRQGPALSSITKDAVGHGSIVKNRDLDFNLSVENNDFLLDAEKLQQLRVPWRKRKRRGSLSHDHTSKRGNAGPRNGTGNLLLPKKKRNLGEEDSKVHSHIDKPHQLASAVNKRKMDQSRLSSHKRVKYDSAQKKKKKKKNHSDVAQKKMKNNHSDATIVGSGLVLLDRPIPSLRSSNKEALTGIHLLSMAAAETGDFESGVSRDILPLYANRKNVGISLYTVAQLKPDVLATGDEGCAQARVPTEYVSVDEAMKSFMLGPENLHLEVAAYLKTDHC